MILITHSPPFYVARIIRTHKITHFYISQCCLRSKDRDTPVQTKKKNEIKQCEHIKKKTSKRQFDTFASNSLKNNFLKRQLGYEIQRFPNEIRGRSYLSAGGGGGGGLGNFLVNPSFLRRPPLPNFYFAVDTPRPPPTTDGL